MEVRLAPIVSCPTCHPTFETLLKSGKLQEYLSILPSAFIRTYSALGKTRLMTLCITSNRFEVNQYLVCMVTSDFVNSTLWELGLIYYEAWEYSGHMRKLSRNMKKQLQELKQEMSKNGGQSLYDNLKYWSKHNRGRRKREGDFVKSIEDILEQGRIKRNKDGKSLLDKLNVIYEKFTAIKRRIGSPHPQYAALPKFAGYLTKDLIHEIALPDLRLCFGLVISANERIKKLEFRWMTWKDTRDEVSTQRKIYFFLSFLAGTLIIFYIIR